MKTLKTLLALAVLAAWILALATLTGCAFNKVQLGSQTGTNTVTAVVRSYAIWPATVDLAKQKASAGKTLAIGTEGLREDASGGTNLVTALAELRKILELVK